MNNNQTNNQQSVKNFIEGSIKLSILFVMVYWCYTILSPFVALILWGAIIAIITNPLCDRVEQWVGNRNRAAFVITIVILVIFISPSVAIIEKLAENTQHLSTQIKEGNLSIPEPREAVKTWPLVGEKLYSIWSDASQNIQALAVKHKDSLIEVSKAALGKATDAGLTILLLIFAIIVAGFFMANAEKSGNFAHQFICRLAGNRGEHFATLASTTVRNVARGIIGVAILQAALAWLGFYAVDFPAAPLFAFLVLALSIVQINPLILMIPTAIYVFNYEDSTLIASAYLVWSIAVGLLDNILKPIIMGKGAGVPMMVIFLGVLGGFVSYGFVGLFLGAVVIVLGYSLFIGWLNEYDQVDEVLTKDSLT